jgi:16S rRNA (guanine527-N7)-methyltransferase
MSGGEIQALLLTEMDLAVELMLAEALARYLAVLVRWNGRTNLSAIRDPGQMVLRHFGESLQCARAIPPDVATLLDYGSGAGFPGAVCALARPGLAVTLAESQGKKAAFLQELCRSLPIAAKVHAARVETMSAELRFDAVTLRAVDRMEEACVEAMGRVRPGGWLVVMTSRAALQMLAPALTGIAWRPPVLLAGTEQGVVTVGRVLAPAVA